MSVKYPCKGCEKRHVGCHSTCQDFADAKEALRPAMEAKHRELNADREYFSYAIPVMHRNKQKANKRT